MKIPKQKKTKIPTKTQIKKMFTGIKDFQKNNTNYLLLTGSQQIFKETVSTHIITTNNTNI